MVGQDDPAGGAPRGMVSPRQQKASVGWAREAYRLPERRACRAMGVSRSTVPYESLRPSREPLRARLRESAAVATSSQAQVGSVFHPRRGPYLGGGAPPAILRRTRSHRPAAPGVTRIRPPILLSRPLLGGCERPSWQEPRSRIQPLPRREANHRPRSEDPGG